MHSAARMVLALLDIKDAIVEFESGNENASDTLARILESCKAASDPVAAKKEAA